MDATTYPTAERLLDAGVAPEFVTVMLADTDDHVGVGRNSVAELVGKFEDPERVAKRGGDFAGNLRDGNLADAFYHADENNTKLLLDLFGPDYLWARGVASGEAPDHFRRILYERTERYRPDLLDGFENAPREA